MLERTPDILSLLDEVLSECRDKKIANTPFLESIVAQYLSVIACAEVEETVADAVRVRLNSATDAGIANFISTTQDKMIRRIPKSDLAETVRTFGDECKEIFNAQCDPAAVSYYSRMIDARHATAHPGSPKISMEDVRKGIGATTTLLNTFAKAIES